MHLSLDTDEFGRLTCELTDGPTHAVITASNMPDAAVGLRTAVERVATGGRSECFWCEAAGEYRWVFRLAGETLTIAVMWSTGTLTGWEHAFWTECNYTAFAEKLYAELDRVGVTAPR